MNEALGTGLTPGEFRAVLQRGEGPELWRRRAVVGLSLFGMANMAAVTLLQTGVVRHLPDPPSEAFDSDKVNSSDTAYQLGTPDGSLSLVGLAANVPLAGFGGEARAERTPLVPLAACAKAALEAVAAGWYFYLMPTKEKKWCAYCIGGAITNFAIFALTVPEARRAWRALRSR